MKVLVTGGAGFIGSHIVDQLVLQGMHPIVVDNLTSGNEQYLKGNVPFYRLDIQDQQMEEVFRQEKPDAVIHHAANVKVPISIKDPIGDAETNILGTIRLLECCRTYHVQKVIFASSAAVYGDTKYVPINEEHPINPLSPYGLSKYSAEYYFKIYSDLYNINYMILRYANVYGPRQVAGGDGGVIAILMNKILQGLPFHIDGDGDQTRDYIYVGDVAAANILALTSGDRDVVNIGTGIRTTLNDLIHLIEDILSQKVLTVYGLDRPGDIKESYYDIHRMRKVLDNMPLTDLKKGLKHTYDYFDLLAKEE